jgi:hypothetical protein
MAATQAAEPRTRELIFDVDHPPKSPSNFLSSFLLLSFSEKEGEFDSVNSLIWMSQPASQGVLPRISGVTI